MQMGMTATTTTTTNVSNDDGTTTELKMSSSSSSSSLSCPYAVQFQQSQTMNGDGIGGVSAAAVKNCPAFASSGSCPFKNAQSAQEIRTLLAQVPPSHYSPAAAPTTNTTGTQTQSSSLQSIFLQVLANVHRVAVAQQQQSDNTANGTSSMSNDTAKYQLPGGGCPMQPLLKNTNNKTIQLHSSYSTTTTTTTTEASFTQVLEGYSLAAIMAQLAEQEEELRGQKQPLVQGLMHQKENQNDMEQEETSNKDKQSITESKSTTSEKKDWTVPQNETTPSDASVKSTNNNNSNLTLSEMLKSGTAESHKAAENVHFVKNFVHGKIDRRLYGELVLMLYHVYRTLEDCLDRCAETAGFASCHFPHQLGRTQRLLQDVDFWHGPALVQQLTQSPSSVSMSPATQDYVQRIEYVAQHDPVLLVAHAYTRYLGDLSGGRILARIAKRAMKLACSDNDGDDGLAFYDFPNITTSATQFKQLYRNCLDQLHLPQQQEQQVDVARRLVAEANVAFCLNMRLFEELDVMANVPGASVRPLDDALHYARQAQQEEQEARPVQGQELSDTNTKIDKCPFAALAAGAGTAGHASIRMPSAGHATTGASTTAATATRKSSASAKTGQCPWPFLLLHNPRQGLADWKTWLCMGLILCWIWSRIVAATYETTTTTT